MLVTPVFTFVIFVLVICGDISIFSHLSGGKSARVPMPTEPLCAICCDSVGKRLLSCSCVRCGFLMCRACARRVACEYHEDPQCPECHWRWDILTTKGFIGNAFYNREFRTSRRRRLCLHEEARFAGTMPFVQSERTRRQLKAQLAELWTLIQRGHHEYVPLRMDLMRRMRHVDRATHPRAPAQNRVRCAACGVMTDGRCAACRIDTCVECGVQREEGGGDHVCDEDVRQTVALMRRECRPCVRCSAPSMRTEGCAVMWCVQCHTFWNWDTMRVIERGVPPHNPDHRAWLMQAPHNRRRELDDVPCGGLPDGGELHAALLREFDIFLSASPHAESIVRAAEAVHHAQRLRHTYPSTWDEEGLNRDLRLAYLIGDIDSDKFSFAVERRHRGVVFKREISELLETFVLAAADVFQVFCAPVRGYTCADTMNALTTIRGEMNRAMRTVEAQHARRAPQVTEAWVWRVPYRGLVP